MNSAVAPQGPGERIHRVVKEPARGADNDEVTAIPTSPAPAAPTLSRAPVPPLTDEHLRQLAASHAQTLKIRRAIGIARFDGWTVGIFGALTLLFGITTVSGVVLGGALGVIAYVEMRASLRLRKLQPASTRVLGFNQLGLACVLITYAAWRIYHEMNGTGEYAAIAASDADLGRVLQPVEDLTRFFILAMYGGLIAVAVFAQGGLALYYFTREKYVRAYLAHTPDWVLAVQRAGRLV
jgi:hypothetical protein